jgi:uncharacterized membrane protein YgcG
VHAGDGFTPAQRRDIDRAIRDAETASRFEFSVYVGASDGEVRPFAERLHAALVAPERSVMVVVDPAARIVEVVTGAGVRRRLPDSSVRLVTLAMQSSFALGDLAGGICRGLRQLADRAHGPQILHAE